MECVSYSAWQANVPECYMYVELRRPQSFNPNTNVSLLPMRYGGKDIDTCNVISHMCMKLGWQWDPMTGTSNWYDLCNRFTHWGGIFVPLMRPNEIPFISIVRLSIEWFSASHDNISLIVSYFIIACTSEIECCPKNEQIGYESFSNQPQHIMGLIRMQKELPQTATNWWRKVERKQKYIRSIHYKFQLELHKLRDFVTCAEWRWKKNHIWTDTQIKLILVGQYGIYDRYRGSLAWKRSLCANTICKIMLVIGICDGFNATGTHKPTHYMPLWPSKI